VKHGNSKISSYISVGNHIIHVDGQVMASCFAEGVAGVAERDGLVGDALAAAWSLAGEDL
jgi:hypothetical protein